MKEYNENNFDRGNYGFNTFKKIEHLLYNNYYIV